MAKKRMLPAPSAKRAPDGGGPMTLYPGKRHAMSIKVTDNVKAIIDTLQRQKHCSASDVINGRMLGEF